MFTRFNISKFVLLAVGATGTLPAAFAQPCQFTWSPLGSELGEAGFVYVNGLQVFDDGTAAALYVAGTFDIADGLPVNGIARWDGSSWSPLGSGMDFYVTAHAVFDDGQGPALYAGGNFTQAGGTPANLVAKWDGSVWSPLGAGLGSDWCPWCVYVNILAVFDDGTGPALYAGGSFTQAGGAPANYIAKWDGSAWSALGSGTDSGPVVAMAAFDDGSGLALYVAGSFDQAGGVPGTDTIAKWDGSTWSALGTGLGEYDVVEDLLVFDDGYGPALYAAGVFNYPTRHSIAKWDGQSWSFFAAGRYHYGNALTVFDDGTGPALYVAGSFTIDDQRTIGVTRWDGTALSLIGGAAGSYVLDLAVFDSGGSGPALYAGGRFSAISGVAADSIARWRCVGRPGDLNCDGAFDGADIDPFFLALGDPPAYAAAFPACDRMLADMNADGFVDGADIDAFFQCLSLGQCP